MKQLRQSFVRQGVAALNLQSRPIEAGFLGWHCLTGLQECLGNRSRILTWLFTEKNHSRQSCYIKVSPGESNNVREQFFGIQNLITQSLQNILAQNMQIMQFNLFSFEII